MTSEFIRRVYIQRCPYGGWCFVAQCTSGPNTLWVEFRGLPFRWIARLVARRFIGEQPVFYMQGRDFHLEQEQARLDA